MLSLSEVIRLCSGENKRRLTHLRQRATHRGMQTMWQEDGILIEYRYTKKTGTTETSMVARQLIGWHEIEQIEWFDDYVEQQIDQVQQKAFGRVVT